MVYCWLLFEAFRADPAVERVVRRFDDVAVRECVAEPVAEPVADVLVDVPVARDAGSSGRANGSLRKGEPDVEPAVLVVLLARSCPADALCSRLADVVLA